MWVSQPRTSLSMWFFSKTGRSSKMEAYRRPCIDHDCKVAWELIIISFDVQNVYIDNTMVVYQIMCISHLKLGNFRQTTELGLGGGIQMRIGTDALQTVLGQVLTC